MGPIVIYYHVNIMESDFKLPRQGLNEFVHLGHKGLNRLVEDVCWYIHTLRGEAFLMECLADISGPQVMPNEQKDQ